MELQGRLLRVVWGPNMVIEFGKIATPPATFGLENAAGKHCRLYDVFDFDGERILRDLGTPSYTAYGRDANWHLINNGYWCTPDEVDLVNKLTREKRGK